MRKTNLLILLALLTVPAAFLQAQPPTPIQGIINTYHRVEQIISNKSCVIVDNAAGLGAGDKVMLVQMKGAGVITNNASAFGDTTGLNNAGNYELGTICSVNGDSVFLLNTIIRNYTIAGKVQLVSVPVYENALVVDSLKAAPWSNAEGKGGVLALSVTYSLFLSAPVSASGAGFNGGPPLLCLGTCTNWATPSGPAYNAANNSPQLGAWKGEGVWEPTQASYTGGKAAVANGGGGGNNHNNGGGGGANIGAGGAGGGNNSTTGCYIPNAGGGGKALDPYGRSKIFPGGGGGAGHVNNGELLEGGGHGGGIVYIQAQSLVSGGYTISANGYNGGNAKGDGASGGGAGGTILLNVQVYSDAVKLEANGGNGGQANDAYISKRCYGEGGGGGGGAIYVRNAPPAGTLSVKGGARGEKINSMPDCTDPVEGSGGLPGATATGYVPIQSSVLTSTCSLLLPATLLSFKASVAQSDVLLRWQVAQPGEVTAFVVERKQDGVGWKEVARTAAREGVDTYSATDRNLANGSYLYRLKIVGRSGAPLYSAQQRVTITSAATLTVYPNPARGTLRILLPAGGAREIRIYDLSGRLLIEKPVGHTHNAPVPVDVSSLKEGLYVLRVGVLHKVFRVR